MITECRLKWPTAHLQDQHYPGTYSSTSTSTHEQQRCFLPSAHRKSVPLFSTKADTRPPTGYVGLFTWAAAAVTAGWRRLSSSLLLFLFLEVLSWMPRMLLSPHVPYHQGVPGIQYAKQHTAVYYSCCAALLSRRCWCRGAMICRLSVQLSCCG